MAAVPNVCILAGSGAPSGNVCVSVLADSVTTVEKVSIRLIEKVLALESSKLLVWGLIFI